jgi:hypothetical protein
MANAYSTPERKQENLQNFDLKSERKEAFLEVLG